MVVKIGPAPYQLRDLAELGAFLTPEYGVYETDWSTMPRSQINRIITNAKDRAPRRTGTNPHSTTNAGAKK